MITGTPIITGKMGDMFPKKSLGQHWLNDDASLEAMCQAAEVMAGDTVLEIGPGQGTLTRHLLARRAKVLALEFDGSLIAPLRQRFATDANFVVEQADVRTYDLGILPAGYKIVANIPYYLTSYLLRLLADTSHKPTVAALLTQKEVAQRVAATSGQLSVISVAMQLQYEVTLGQLVPAKLFSPPPKVDSQILILSQRPDLLFSDIEPKALLRLAKAGFAQPRKTLLNNLSSSLKLDREATTKLIEQAGLEPTLRAQALSLSNWHELSVAAQAAGVLH